ncbi:hypothetical protein FZC84_11110 [Rossellomorea vietnamensis]|uniref:Uncharacterized protein n=1 Tax=Rossellomorea vietnamensis TaxID=218284 RepID=A0A5D4MCT1_9BACI|nr:hypothetical protein [Rossellomorea vietnamensis]TYR99298.1 hypothetical protein FZC84_11110 [Rossellomorea vietnamensis]
MNFREEPISEQTLLSMRKTLKDHEAMIFSLQTIVEKQQEMIERLAGRDSRVKKPSFLETLDMEKLIKIAIFTATLYNNDESGNQSL